VKTARILVVDDEANIRVLLDEILSEEGYLVTTAADAREARVARSDNDFDLVLLDIWMPDIDGITLLKEWSEGGKLEPVVMMSGHGTVDTAVEATRLGALDFIEKPVSLAKLLRTVDKALTQRRSAESRRRLVPPLFAPIGKSEVMRVLRDQVQRVANHDAHTLLTGEPGSGREAFARYLASVSNRSTEPFVTVMGGTLTDVDSRRELMGSEQQPGLIAQASGGVLFINEIGDMSVSAQQLLLGVLEQGRYRQAVEADDRPFNLRILSSAATKFERNSDQFRRELFSHLSAVVIRVPPLRDYAEDVPELLRYYVDMLVDSDRLPFRRFSVAAQNRLRNYPWPGNVGELKNIVSRLLILSADEEITLKEVEEQLEAEGSSSEPLVKQDLLSMPLREAREHFERAYLQQQLILCGGKVGQLAKRVGMERTHLYRKLRSLGVDFRQVTADDS
jgi:two-component system nitrogen regulation response regulator NtrX